VGGGGVKNVYGGEHGASKRQPLVYACVSEPSYGSWPTTVIGLVDPHVQRGLGLAGVETNHRQAGVDQRLPQPGRQGPGLQPDAHRLRRMLADHRLDRLRRAGAAAAPDPLVLLIQDMHLGFFQRDVQSDILTMVALFGFLLCSFRLYQTWHRWGAAPDLRYCAAESRLARGAGAITPCFGTWLGAVVVGGT
jgi:hypothetical protein